MSIIKIEDGKKWINSFLAIISLIVGFVTIRFIEQMSEWFELEAKISNFHMGTQVLGVVIGFATFVYGAKSGKVMGHLKEVFGELVKVIWPDKDSVVKVTIGIIIGLIITSGIFVGVDYAIQSLLKLVY